MEYFQIILTFLQAISTVAIPAYFVWKQRTKESETAVAVSKIENADDMLLAYGNLQSQLATAAENMVKPLNLQIADQQRRILQQAEEIKQLRDFVKDKSQEQELITKRVAALELENIELREQRDRSLANERRMRSKLAKIRKDIDTGELSSGIHKIDKKDDDNDGI